MKKLTSLALVLTFIVSLFTPHAYAAKETAYTKAKVTASSLNVRSKPDLKSKVIGKAKKNETVLIASEMGKWSKIIVKKGTGWVYSQYLKKETTPTHKVGYITAKAVNVRKKATTSSAVSMTLNTGDKVTILQTTSSWTKIQKGSKVGWVSNRYVSNKAPTKKPAKKEYAYVKVSDYLTLRAKPSTRSKSLAKLKSGVKLTVLSTSGKWKYVEVNGKKGWVAASYLSAKKPGKKTTPKPKPKPETIIVYVGSGTLNLRDTASTAGHVVSKLKVGDPLTVSKEKDGWLYVTTKSGECGWVSKRYVLNTPPKTDEVKSLATKTGYVTVNDLNVRSNAGTSYKVVTQVNQADKVTVYSSKNGWLHIKTPKGIKGWVNKHYISYLKIPKDDGGQHLPSNFSHLKGKTIMIDPGHGGHDSGAVGYKSVVYEKDLALSTSIILARKLRAAGAKVLMTRSSDVFIELAERPQMSNRAHVDAFVAVHYNSGPSAGHGLETYYQQGSKYRNMASYIQSGIVKYTGLTNRGIGPNNLQVLRTNTRPCVLVELGFVSNPKEVSIIKTATYQQKAAAGIAVGLNKYFK
ncbi:putative N-acetylmuramoyl-L-alanine amidase [Fictibacillus macauensis ZFHKF-1]|uniref:Putative N-acetylmuramoyl-L-alanine amidase n=1 Tax=Fictibacillus macauensis ZFHKF-1 TaxID=1196324 RepID=I8J3E4_9BACL|nr:SH3 domain-containing protein [Fictibacillus macauensis]EIT86291.1 putative N-acetylmuramoyl-L-alanine amidase [Fictibacillus macauensis ZFHKF-1]